MPIKFGFTPIVTKEEKKAVKQQKKVAAKEKKEVTKRRQYLEDSSLYGNQLFEPVVTKEKSIAVIFPNRFTDNKTRISTCGKFAFRPMDEFHYELFYLAKKPILEYDNSLVIEPYEDNILFDLLLIDELENLIIALVQIEFRDEKVRLLAQIIEDERQNKLEKEKRETEEEKLLEEELLKVENNEANQPTVESISSNDAIREEKLESEEKKEISSEIGEKKEATLREKNKTETRFVGGFFFRSSK